MARRGGGFGLVMLVVVMAIVLLLVARSWRSVAPTAAEVAPSATAVPTPAADLAPELGALPRLSDMQRETDAHAADVEKALSEID